MTSTPRQEPTAVVQRNGVTITLLGTAHVSRASSDKVRDMLQSGQFDAVAVELCPSRFNAIVEPDALQKMDLFQVFRQGKASMVAANLALGAFQQRLAEQLGVEPGQDMRTAIEYARASHLPVLLIDREIGVTLRRVYRSVPWWQRLGLAASLVGSVLSRQEITEQDIERLKEGDILESSFREFAEQAQDLYVPLVAERDQYMAARLRKETDQGHHRQVLAVVGAGHLAGIRRELEDPTAPPPVQVLADLDSIPPSSRWPKLIPWLIVALILAGFAVGFSRNADLGWRLVTDWVLINGVLAAAGALAAAAHPLTVVSAFVAAPLTSLNPTIGVGMVTATAELFFRKPNVGDFSRLRSDTARLRGWWSNRVARVLLVFLFTTIGSAVGTYAAGLRIWDRLAG